MLARMRLAARALQGAGASGAALSASTRQAPKRIAIRFAAERQAPRLTFMSLSERRALKHQEPVPPVKRLSRDDVSVHFVRSSGAGGQHVNKVSTKVDMRLDLRAPWLHERVREALEKMERNRINKEGQLVLSSQRTRSQADNLEDALTRLQAMLDAAWEAVQPVVEDPAKRKRIEVARKQANEARLKDKKIAKDKKSFRTKDW